ncbi:MAG: hypothetical protein ACFFHD_02950 [Promethearchaeota archaeon]
MPHLPCKKCGSCLPLVKGVRIQCPYCGSKTFYMESVYVFKFYILKILHLKSIKQKKKIADKELNRRKILIRSYFHNLYTNINEYRHLVITKLDEINIDMEKLFNLIREVGNFEIIVDQFLLNYLPEGNEKIKFQEIRDFSYIFNKSLLGLYYSYLAKEFKLIEHCYKLYNYAEKNYQNIVDYCNISLFEDNNSHISKKKEIYSIVVKFVSILRNILNKNPMYYSKELKSLLERLGKFKEKNIQLYNLYAQIDQIYQLERDTTNLLETVRIDNPFSLTETVNENLIQNMEDDLNKFNYVRNWIKEISNKFNQFQKNLLKLHSGRLIKYLESYREEFLKYKNKNIEKIDDLLGTMVNKAFDTYNSEIIEALDILSYFMQKNIYNEEVIERFEIKHDDFIQIENMLTKFINNLFKKPILRNVESEYYKKLISLMSGKRTEFDNYILKYINCLLKKFEEIRNKKILSLEQQRAQFVLEIKPNLQKLLNLSFTLNEKNLPYPLFIDICWENKKLKVDYPENVILTIENPNLIDIKDIKIYFFLPDSFQTKLKFTNIKRLKANETRKIKTRIIPREQGTFLSMVMMEYQHTNKTFWMPSIKFELEVDNIKKYAYYPMNKANYKYLFEANQRLKFIRSFI